MTRARPTPADDPSHRRSVGGSGPKCGHRAPGTQLLPGPRSGLHGRSRFDRPRRRSVHSRRWSRPTRGPGGSRAARRPTPLRRLPPRSLPGPGRCRSRRGTRARSCCSTGPNGAGKTTLLRLIAGLVPLHSGEAEVLRHRPRSWTGAAPRRQLALVGHETFCYDDLTVRENLRFVARASGGAGTDADPIIERLGLGRGRRPDPPQALGRPAPPARARRGARPRPAAPAPRRAARRARRRRSRGAARDRRGRAGRRPHRRHGLPRARPRPRPRHS